MTLKLNGSTSGSVSLDAPASTTSGADITFKLPVADGTSGQALVTDASGQLSFATAGQTYPAGYGAFHVYRTASQSCAQNAYTKIEFNVEGLDSQNWFDASTNYTFTPQVAGWYQINTQVLMAWSATNTADEMFIQIYKNNAQAAIGNYNGFASGPTSGYKTRNWSGLIQFNGSSDYIDTRVYHYNTNSANNANGGLGNTYMSGHLVYAT